MGSNGRSWEERLRGVPNLLVFIRLGLVFIFFGLLVGRSYLPATIHPSWWDYFSSLLFVIASITDFFDGYIARNFNAITPLGELLDPLADKLLILGALIGLVYLHRADPLAVLLILTREFIITGLRVEMVRLGLSIGASWSGKVKTVLQMIAIGFLLMDWCCGNLLLWLAVGVTLWSGWEYFMIYYRAISPDWEIWRREQR
ncbi:MAG: CDP-diacylglycerol--glycerol-3-phosphate 3-phosphatidyltransferase [Campylobacterales bacterium]